MTTFIKTAKAGGNTPTTSQTAQAHPYRADEGCSPKQLKDVPAQGYVWGNVSGLALVVDLFNWRDVLTEQEATESVTEFVRAMMESASKELIQPFNEFKDDHRGVAVGMLEGFAALVAFALESKDARSFMEKQLHDQVTFYEVLSAQEMRREKALALDIHGLAHAKGGPRND